MDPVLRNATTGQFFMAYTVMLLGVAGIGAVLGLVFTLVLAFIGGVS